MSLFLLLGLIFSGSHSDNGELQLRKDESCQNGSYCRRREQNLPVCPAGFFCPEGSTTPVPCPPGTFRGEGVTPQSCLSCPVGFFNPMPAQKACLPCGSQAAQPAEGQETCVCLGQGQVFQPRDAHCTCPPGYWGSLRDERHCVRQAYDVCRDSASRNQEGQCLTKEGWAQYCSEKVCAAPRDYRGYDKTLGLCICQTDSLESVCNSPCRRQQRDTLQVTCSEENTQLFITYRNGSKIAVVLEELRTVLLRPYFSFKEVCFSEQSMFTHPTYMVKMSGEGFLGVYNPDPQLFHNFILLNEASSHHKNNPPSPAAPVESGHEEHWSSQVQSLGSSNSTSKILFTGILNPTTCINVNATILFIVSKEHYPLYDVNNLYNTNPAFDWGDFRSLREELREASQKFLLFLFQFQDPGTYVLQLSSNQHKRMYIRVMPPGGRCYEEGPFFPTTPRHAVQVGIARNPELLLKPDWAAVSGVISGLLLLLVASGVVTLLCQRLSWSQKVSPHPPFRRQQLKHNLDSYCSSAAPVLSISNPPPSLHRTACCLRSGEVWEPEDQVDLESFNTHVFFELLLRQSLSVTAKLGHLKEEVKTIYHKLTSEVSSLKTLWIRTLNSPEGMEGCDSTLTEAYLKAKQQAEEEIQRRKQLAAEYEEGVNTQMKMLEQELEHQGEHWVLFHSALREVLRLAEMLTHEVACKGRQTTLSEPDCSRLLARLEAASSQLSHAVLRESRRLRARALLAGEAGAQRLGEAESRILTKQQLVGEHQKAEVPTLPYIPYPVCPSTGLPVATTLPVLCPDKVFSVGGLMLDPVTETEVPVLAVTVHPHTGQKLAVGGMYLNPFTAMLTPLEIGAPMAEPEGGRIVPILGVALDSDTGEVVPLGGLTGPSGDLMLLGDPFPEALSGRSSGAGGAEGGQGAVPPRRGSPRAVLRALSRAVTALRQLQAALREHPALAAASLAALKASAQEAKDALRRRLYRTTHRLQSLQRKQEIASSFKRSGGKLGMIKYPGTEMWMPAVFGMKIPDPGGSGLMVPILGIECDWNTRQPSLLAGTMEDRNGKGLVPITIGARAVSPITGEIGPVIGAQTNPWTHNVIPTVQSRGALPRRTTDPELLDFLEEEINSRQTYWHCRRRKEEWLLQELDSLFLQALGAVKGEAQKIKFKEKVKDMEEMCHQLQGSSLWEVERRTSKYFSSQLATELSFLFRADTDEKEQEAQVLLEIRKALEKLMEFLGKMRLEEEQLKMQEMERVKQRSRVSNTETAAKLKLRKVTLALAPESQECLLKQQANVETAYTKLEYLRDLSNIQIQQAKVLLSGSPQCFENYQTTPFYGMSGISHSTCQVIQQNLIPLLQSVLQMLEKTSRSSDSAEAAGKRKAAAHSETRTEASQEATSASITAPVLPISHSERESHIQEAQTRFEESSSELEDKVDVLTEELVDVIEDENRFLNSKHNEDLLSYYMEITNLEKDCLVKQINALEEKIALSRKL